MEIKIEMAMSWDLEKQTNVGAMQQERSGAVNKCGGINNGIS